MEGDIASFFVDDLGLALAPKMCPDQSQAFKLVNNSKASAVGRKTMTHFFFQAEDGIRDVERSRGLGDVYKRQALPAIYLTMLSRCSAKRVLG